jgi:8-amino-7-oxononanoate synthase
LISGHTSAHQALEEALANYTRQEKALLFSTGYTVLIPNYSQYILKLKLIIMVGIKIIVQIADIHFI